MNLRLRRYVFGVGKYRDEAIGNIPVHDLIVFKNNRPEVFEYERLKCRAELALRRRSLNLPFRSMVVLEQALIDNLLPKDLYILAKRTNEKYRCSKKRRQYLKSISIQQFLYTRNNYEKEIQ